MFRSRVQNLPNPLTRATTLLLSCTLFLASCGGGSGSGSSSGTNGTAATSTAGHITITPTTLANGQSGQPYSATLAATGGTAPYTWTLSSGTLPSGLTLNAATGVISGTPTATAANVAVSFSVTDASSPAQSASVSLTFTILASALTSAVTSLPNGMVGVAYSSALAANGATPPYTWTLTSGTLPAGLTLSTAGVISGTPTATAAQAPLGFTVTDSGTPAQTLTLPLTLTIAPPGLDISTTSVPSGTVGLAYSTTLTANGGTAPYSWRVTSGTLPAGLSLSSTTGVISGTPTAVASSPVTFSVTDAETPAQSATATVTVAVTAPPLTSTLTTLPAARVGAAYSTTLTASGGTAPYTWTLTSGTLPTGLVLASTGAISGTPTAPVASAALTFTAHDSGTPAQSVALPVTLTVAPATLAISTTALPNGSVGTAYTATLAATGGTSPYSWSLTSGTLPAGLSLAAATGVISGTPTAGATSSPIGLTVSDSGTPAQTAARNLNLTVATVGTGAVTLTPTHAEVTLTQPLALSAQTSDGSGVQWSISPAGGSFSTTTSTSGSPVTLTAPATAGRYTVSATSTVTGAVASLTVAVTDLAGVFTYHDDESRDGANVQEYALTTANVTTGAFGKLFSCAADGAIYAQPLWVANLTVNGARHNVVFVATEHDGVFAYDADTSPCVTLWNISLVDTAHGATAGESSVPYLLVGNGPTAPSTAGDIQPEIGVTGTPVIDPTTNTLYVVSKSVDATQTNFYQRLHAINITTGTERGTPVTIAASAAGTYNGAAGTVVFNAQEELQRPALALANGYVYVGFAGHEDHAPFFGWTLAYAYDTGTGALSSGTAAATLNSNPNTGYGGIWMGGSGPAVDESGNLYLMTGNGTFNGNTGGTEYGDSMLKLSATLGISQYFTPTTYATDATNDKDLGAGGAAILADLPINNGTSGIAHLILGGGKDGTLYVLNRDMLGGLDSTATPVAWQEIPFGAAIFSTGAFWNNTFFLRGANIGMKQYALNSTTAMFGTTAAATSATSYGFLTNSPSVSASGTTNGIVWDLDTHTYCTHNAASCGPAVLHAFDATNVGTELWNSAQVATDAAGNAVKFTLPTIANGRVYVGTRGNNTGGAYASTSESGELDVYGLTH